jgi:hypothetical protein
MFVQTGDDRLAAALEGELGIRDDCLVLLTGSASFAIAWHASVASWKPDESAIQIGGVRAEVGDRVALGGGEMSVRADNLGNWRWAIAPSENCLAQDGFWFAWGLEHI